MPPSNLVPVAAWRDCGEPAEFPVLAFRVGALGQRMRGGSRTEP